MTNKQLLEAGVALQTIGARLYCFNVGIPLEYVIDEAKNAITDLQELLENVAALKRGEGPLMIVDPATTELLEYRRSANQERNDALSFVLDAIAQHRETLDGYDSTA